MIPHDSAGVSLAWVAVEDEGLPGVWKARSARIDGLARLMGGVLRTAKAPPRGLLGFSGPHMFKMTAERNQADVRTGC